MDQDSTSDQSYDDILIALVVEAWRFSRASTRIVEKLDAGVSSRFANQVRYFQQRIVLAAEDAGLRLVNLEGQAYDPGTAAAALNMEDFEPADDLLVDQMIEPILMGEKGVRRQGTVLLRKRT